MFRLRTSWPPLTMDKAPSQRGRVQAHHALWPTSPPGSQRHRIARTCNGLQRSPACPSFRHSGQLFGSQAAVVLGPSVTFGCDGACQRRAGGGMVQRHARRCDETACDAGASRSDVGASAGRARWADQALLMPHSSRGLTRAGSSTRAGSATNRMPSPTSLHGPAGGQPPDGSSAACTSGEVYAAMPGDHGRSIPRRAARLGCRTAADVAPTSGRLRRGLSHPRGFFGPRRTGAGGPDPRRPGPLDPGSADLAGGRDQAGSVAAKLDDGGPERRRTGRVCGVSPSNRRCWCCSAAASWTCAAQRSRPT